jgi:hypothetical protein
MTARTLLVTVVAAYFSNIVVGNLAVRRAAAIDEIEAIFDGQVREGRVLGFGGADGK